MEHIGVKVSTPMESPLWAQGRIRLGRVDRGREENGVTTWIRSRNYKYSALVERLIFTRAHV